MIDSKTKLLTRRWGWIAIAILLLMAAVAGYQQLYSSFAPYDDEGYLMVSPQSYLAGHTLYDDTYTQYGPAFYILNSLGHTLSGLPITHDVTRLKTLGIWLATAAMCGVFVHRLTGSQVLGAMGLLAAFFHLDRLGLEPGHPQEVCLLAISASLLLGRHAVRETVWNRGRVFFRGAPIDVMLSMLLGVLASIVIMTKINIGGLLFAGSGLALLVALPTSKLRATLLPVFVGGVMLLPWLLAREHLFERNGFLLPVVSVTSLVGVGLVLHKVGPCGRLSSGCWWSFSSGFGAGCLLFAAVALWQGTSLSGLLHGVLLQHLGFMEGFYENPPIYTGAVPAAALAVVIALGALHGWRPAARLARLGLLVGVCLRHLGDTFVEIRHGANDRGQAALLMSFWTPMLWLLFLPYLETASRRDALLGETFFARLLLCAMGLLQPLGAFPVPGTQMAVGSLALLLALLVCMSDIMRFQAMLGADEARLARALAGGLVGLSVITVLCRDVHGWHRRAQLTLTELAGAERLCLPADYVAQKRWTVDQLRARAETFICMQNGHNSLYCWSRIAPPTAINTTLWQDLLDETQQRRIVAELAKHPRVCVVVDRDEPLPRRRDGPLTRYVLECFEPVARRGGIEIWQRRERLAITHHETSS